jgi:hypothetical protein
VIATVGDEQTQRYPALVAQRFGNGRAAAITIGDMWRWGLKQDEMHDDMDKFWRQTVRWLVADVPGRTSLRIARERDKANQPVALRVDVRDNDFEPMDNVSVSIELRDPNDQTVRLRAEAVPGESGLFEAVYVPRLSGGYFARAVVTDEKDNKIGDAETGWAVDLEAREFRSIKANRPLLERIASRTGGRMVELDELNDFAQELPSRDVPITTMQIKPLWDLPGVLPAIYAGKECRESKSDNNAVGWRARIWPGVYPGIRCRGSGGAKDHRNCCRRRGGHFGVRTTIRRMGPTLGKGLLERRGEVYCDRLGRRR